MPQTFFTEVLFPDDPDRDRLPMSTPFGVDEHPFRVLVHDSEFHLVAIGSIELGPLGDPYLHAREYAQGWPSFAMAILLNRSANTLETTFVKPLDQQHATTRTHRRH